MTDDFPFDMSMPQEEPLQPAYYSQIMSEETMKERITLHNIEVSVNSCMLCPLNEFVKPLDLSKVNQVRHLMIIGEDPTDVLPQYEGGSQIHELLAPFGLNMDYIHLTSLVKCIGSKNYQECHHHLVSEVISIAPKVIIAIGYNAAFPFMSHIAQANAQQITPGLGYRLENGTDMIVVNKPGDAKTNPQSMNELNYHLQMAITQLNNRVNGGY